MLKGKPGNQATGELRLIVQSIRQGYRRRMERGEFIANTPPYGYRSVGRGKLDIVPEEAEVIRWVFESYLSGHSATWIAAEMNRKNIRKKYRAAKWTKDAIIYWLKNEKYIGDALCQKTFSSGFPFITRKNQGELDQFYIENCHPAIISREVFDRVQALLRQKEVRVSKPAQYPLSKKMICGNCGTTLYRKVSKRGTAIWNCSRRIENTAACPTMPIMERDVYTVFVRVYNKLRLHESIILRPALGQLKDLETALQRENPAMLEINRAIAQANEQNYKISTLRSKGLLDADACAAKLASLDAQLTQLRAKRRKLLKNDDVSEAAETLQQTVAAIQNGPECLAEFDEKLFADLVERITVDSSGLRFRLKGGIEVTERFQEGKG